MPHDFTVGFRRLGLSLTVLRLDDVPLAFFRTPGSRLKSGTISRLILSAVVVGLYSETATAHGVRATLRFIGAVAPLGGRCWRHHFVVICAGGGLRTGN